MRATMFGVGLALVLSSPALAQTAAPDAGSSMRQWWNDMLGAVDPWLADLAEKLGDLTGWHAPEVLENGDILIRRRQPVEAPPDQPSDSSGSSAPLEL